MQPLDNFSATFYAISNDKTIELVDNYHLTNEFKQLVCLPYFKDIFRVLFCDF